MKPPESSLFRSEPIALCQLFLQPEAAYASVSELGESGVVQFRDLNPDVTVYQRKFVNELRRCDEMERKLRYVHAELHKDRVPIPPASSALVHQPRAPNPGEMINLEARFEKTENEIVELSRNAVNMNSTYLELTELRCVLERTHHFFAEPDSAGSLSLQQHFQLTTTSPTSAAERTAADASAANSSRLGFVAGVIERELVAGFERMLWRISRGNVFLRRADLDEPLRDPRTGHPLYKTVFVAFFQGDQLKQRIKKVCSGYHAAVYPCPHEHAERAQMLADVRTRLADLQLVLGQTAEHRQRVLRAVARDWRAWSVMVCKMKAIYYTLNMFNMDVSTKCLIAECWVPVNDLAAVQRALAAGSEAVGSTIQSFLNVIEPADGAAQPPPPTFHRVNRLTAGFQTLIDAYGMATSGEVNPALYATITFPFLFATMFGDVGHGLMLALFGGWMVCAERRLQRPPADGGRRSEIWQICFGGRYIILLMGLFSMYTGAVYNELFGKPVNAFGSAWSWSLDGDGGGRAPAQRTLTLDPAGQQLADRTYALGVDPVWALAENALLFTNSYKMRMAIIVGVAHMVFGVCLSAVNMRHFGRAGDVWLRFVPQLLFLVLLFGYLAFLMVFKWLAYGAKMREAAGQPHCAPSILIVFINMMLLKEDERAAGEGCEAAMYAGQAVVQRLLLVVALLCVPWLLLARPVWVWLERRRRRRAAEQLGETNLGMELQEDDGVVPTTAASATTAVCNDAHGGGEHGDEEESMVDVFILESIHTIEYVLSTISHTASYLRLWALSLAHSELSVVLWDMVLRKGLGTVAPPWGGLWLAVIFACFAFLTVPILVLMEALSAFLHCLRLHWVEFMSKFYEGLGYAFVPFSFRAIVEQEEEEEELYQ